MKLLVIVVLALVHFCHSARVDVDVSINSKPADDWFGIDDGSDVQPGKWFGKILFSY